VMLSSTQVYKYVLKYVVKDLRFEDKDLRMEVKDLKSDNKG